jgi:hypothetical protein
MLVRSLKADRAPAGGDPANLGSIAVLLALGETLSDMAGRS